MDYCYQCNDGLPFSLKRRRINTRTLLKYLVIMKLIILITFFSLQASAAVFAQQIDITYTNASLREVMQAVRKQSGYYFFIESEYLKTAKPVTVNLKQASIEKTLQTIFADQPFNYQIDGKAITLTPKDKQQLKEVFNTITVTGKITDGEGTPLPGAFIVVKGTQRGTISNEKGEYSLKNIPDDAILLISFTGYVPRQIAIDGKSEVNVRLVMASNLLDETVIMAYGTTSRRLNTGSISKVSGEDINSQPVSNPLAALEGRVTGMIVTQTSGNPGSSFKVQIRGQNSLINGSEPLFIIDGVPFAPNNASINQINSIVNGGISPFSFLNPDEIQSIEVLKDADATAIYGSRGGNGVVIITTKKGKAGKPVFNANVQTGQSRITKGINLLNTPQYIAMRREAFKNDNIIANGTNAPDLTLWDTTRNKNWKDWLMGGTAQTTNANASISGGTENTQFLLSGNYHHETTVFPGEMKDDKGGLHFSLDQKSLNDKFRLNFSAGYTIDNNQLSNASGLGATILLPPNAPDIYDSTGKLKWEDKGVAFANPMAIFLKKYSIKTETLISSLVLSYNPIRNLSLKSNFGFNSTNVNDYSTTPIAAQDPNGTTPPLGSAQFGTNRFKSVLIEPQAEYSVRLSRSKVNVLVGGSWQRTIKDGSYINGTNYTSDNQLNSITAAPTVADKYSNYSKYLYAAAFARINYNIKDKILLNLSGRRDGSSRFGPDKRFSNFGAIGASWILSEEKFFKQLLSVANYGKIRTSYGLTGNDQIGDYKYLDTWSALSPYNQTTALKADILYNPDFTWEKTKKFEAAIELGFLDNKIFTSIAYFKNRSSNQLVQYSLPSQTGFNSILENFQAEIENTGWEIEINANIIKSGNFRWQSAVNLTIPKNRLVAFPGLSSSTYSTKYEVGKSTSAIRGYKYLGVDSATGVYKFDDYTKDGSLSLADYQSLGDLVPRFYGGFRNTFTYSSLTLDVFFEFRKQTGTGYINSIYYSGSFYPGLQFNQSNDVLNRWQTAGDNAIFEKYTASNSSDAYKVAGTIRESNLLYTDASFIRLKNISLSYSLPQKWMHNVKISACQIYVIGQNLMTFTNYNGGDPETQSFLTLPPLKTISAGIKLTLQ